MPILVCRRRRKMQFIRRSTIRIPKRKGDSHKGENGSVLVVGGCEDYVGAVTLSGLAALRSGADLVKVIAPEKVAWAINAYSPDIITRKISGRFFIPSHFDIVNAEVKKFDVLLIGNGMGLNEDTRKFCRNSRAPGSPTSSITSTTSSPRSIICCREKSPMRFPTLAAWR